MKSKKPQPAFIEFASLPRVPDRYKDEISYKILRSGHRNLKKLLDQIIQNKQINMTKELKYFIDRVPPHKEKYIVGNGKLVCIREYNPEEELLEALAEPGWFRRIRIELINYLTDENEDKRRLKKCPFCKEYFIANHLRRKKCESENCRKEYRRRQKAKQRASDPVKYI
jgi:hypothetical protein